VELEYDFCLLSGYGVQLYSGEIGASLGILGPYLAVHVHEKSFFKKKCT